LIVCTRARTGTSSPKMDTRSAPSMMRRASVPCAAKPTKTMLAAGRHRLYRRWWRTRPPVHMPEPAMITAPPSMRFSAIDPAASRTKRSPGGRIGSWPLRNSSAVSASKHSGCRRYTSVAEIAIGESRKTGSCSGSRPSAAAARRWNRTSCVRSSAKLGMITLPLRRSVALIASHSSATESFTERWQRSP
jgi:hypothetical protein